MHFPDELGMLGHGYTTTQTLSLDVTDDEWAFVSPYLVLMDEATPQRTYDLREVFNALRWTVRTGAPRHMLPHDLPPPRQPCINKPNAGCALVCSKPWSTPPCSTSAKAVDRASNTTSKKRWAGMRVPRVPSSVQLGRKAALSSGRSCLKPRVSKPPVPTKWSCLIPTARTSSSTVAAAGCSAPCPRSSPYTA
jgi:transposase